MNRDEARAYFQKSGLTYQLLTGDDIRRLHVYVGDALRDYSTNGNEHAVARGMCVSKLHRKDIEVPVKGGLQFAEIHVDGSYFKRRPGITFNTDEFIGFAGEFDDQNVQPLLEAFCSWCDELKKDKKTA